MKRDFESAFQHIPVSQLDVPLLGFHWESTYYMEQFLPFVLCTAPYLFNLFAEVFHWFLERELQCEHQQLHIIHYLDDFLLVLAPGSNLLYYSTKFTTLCHEMGLTIKLSKNEEGRIASFAGVELDTSTMVIPLPTKKLQKARQMVLRSRTRRSVSLRELQEITGL